MNLFRKYLLLSLIFAAFNATLLLIFFIPRINHTDTRDYVATIQYISGNSEGKLYVYRILKPAPMLIGALLTPVLSPKNSLIFQNLIFYFLSVWLIFLLISRIYQNQKQAFYGTVLYTAAYPMLAYGLVPLTDMPGWFFYLFSVLISLNLIKKNQLKTVILSGFIAGIGMLFKESVAAAPIFFISFLFITIKIPFKEKLKYILIFGLSFLLPVLINSIIIYKLYSCSYLHWYIHVWENHPQANVYAYTTLRILIEFGRVFLIGWIFVLVGILKEVFVKNIQRIKILISFILPSLSFFLWAFPHNRLIYIAFPLLVLLGSFGLLREHKNQRINNFAELSLLILYVLSNYILLEFLLRYGEVIQPPGTLFG